jgi:hypothetical protein
LDLFGAWILAFGIYPMGLPRFARNDTPLVFARLTSVSRSNLAEAMRLPRFARNARRGVEENRVDPFYLKKGGGQLHAAPLSNLYPFPPLPPEVISLLPAPGNQPGNLIEIPLLLTGNRENIMLLLKLLRSLWARGEL